VREAKTLTLDQAIRKMSLMPAQRLEKLAPQFRNKGRIKLGADADIAVFDPATVIDKSTYQSPAAPAVGFRFVLVNGVPVVRDGSVVDGVLPGRAARAPGR
jgi:dihydroorotase